MTDVNQQSQPDPKEDAYDPHIQLDYMADLKEALRSEDSEAVLPLVDDLLPADLADVLEVLPARERGVLVDLLGDRLDPEVLTEVEGEARDQMLDQLPTQKIAEVVLELDSDDAIDVLEDMDLRDRDEVLASIEDSERRAFEKALAYPEESAGRLMQTSFLALPEFWTVGQTIDLLRTEDENLPTDFYDVFIVDPMHRPLGKVPVSRILRMQRSACLGEVMLADPHLVDPFEDQEEVAYQFAKYHLISAAVVDESKRLVGVITVDDVVDVIGEEASEDILALAGVADAGVNESVADIAKSRFSWLLVNLGTAILASLVIGIFEDSLQQMVALAVLMPIVASMGGNAGTQTMTVAVRALATKELSGVNAPRVLRREVLISLLNGLGLAIIAGGTAWAWFGDPMLGAVFSIAMIINLLFAAAGGLLIPLGLTKIGVDPAVSSSVFVTTLTDVIGFFAFLGLAVLALL